MSTTKNTFSLYILITIFLIASCLNNNKKEEAKSNAEQETKVEEVSDENLDSYRDFEEYLYENRAVMIAEADSLIREADRQLVRLESDLAEQGAESSDTLDKLKRQTIDRETEQRDRLQIEVEKLRSSSEEAWEEIRTGFTAAINALEQTIRASAGEFRSEAE